MWVSFRCKFLVEVGQFCTHLNKLENVAGALGERLLRMKAIVLGPTGHDRVLLQSVGTTFSAPRRFTGEATPDLSAIFIVRDCGLQDIEPIPSACKLNWTVLLEAPNLGQAHEHSFFAENEAYRIPCSRAPEPSRVALAKILHSLDDNTQSVEHLASEHREVHTGSRRRNPFIRSVQSLLGPFTLKGRR